MSADGRTVFLVVFTALVLLFKLFLLFPRARDASGKAVEKSDFGGSKPQSIRADAGRPFFPI